MHADENCRELQTCELTARTPAGAEASEGGAGGGMGGCHASDEVVQSLRAMQVNQFTCFTGTKVQILTVYVYSSRGWMLTYADVC